MSVTTRTGFSAELWERIVPTFDAILAHPFLTGITDGTLAEEKFLYFIEQDTLYLRDYSRALAYAGGHALDPADTAMFTSSATSAIAVEAGVHAELLESFGVPATIADDARLSPSGQLYVNTVLLHGVSGPFSIAVAGILACAWIYAEVGTVLIEQGSPDPRYQRWIDTYADPDYLAMVEALLQVVDRIGAESGPAERERIARIFEQGALLEWMFWDAAWRLETWPAPAA